MSEKVRNKVMRQLLGLPPTESAARSAGVANLAEGEGEQHGFDCSCAASGWEVIHKYGLGFLPDYLAISACLLLYTGPCSMVQVFEDANNVPEIRDGISSMLLESRGVGLDSSDLCNYAKTEQVAGMLRNRGVIFIASNFSSRAYPPIYFFPYHTRRIRPLRPYPLPSNPRGLPT